MACPFTLRVNLLITLHDCIRNFYNNLNYYLLLTIVSNFELKQINTKPMIIWNNDLCDKSLMAYYTTIVSSPIVVPVLKDRVNLNNSNSMTILSLKTV